MLYPADNVNVILVSCFLNYDVQMMDEPTILLFEHEQFISRLFMLHSPDEIIHIRIQLDDTAFKIK